LNKAIMFSSLQSFTTFNTAPLFAVGETPCCSNNLIISSFLQKIALNIAYNFASWEQKLFLSNVFTISISFSKEERLSASSYNAWLLVSWVSKKIIAFDSLALTASRKAKSLQEWISMPLLRQFLRTKISPLYAAEKKKFKSLVVISYPSKISYLLWAYIIYQRTMKMSISGNKKK